MLAYVKHAREVKGTMCTFELMLVLNAHMQYSNWYNEHEGENGWFMGSEAIKWHEDQASQACSLLHRRGITFTDSALFKSANVGVLTDYDISRLEGECQLATHF